VADKYGGRKSLIASVGSISLLTLLSPIAAEYGPEYLFLVRFLQGISNVKQLSWEFLKLYNFNLGFIHREHSCH